MAKKMINIEEFTKNYAIAALWSSTNDEGKPLDEDFDIDDISQETLQEMRGDCEDFIQDNESLLLEAGAYNSGYSLEESAGHDFWLTRNRHGTGFWDRGLGAIGEKLSEAAKVYGEVYLYIGDDGLLHS